MTDLTPLLPKLEPLMRMLASENDGEALNAARALGRALKGAGADFNDLAERITAEPPSPKFAYGDEWHEGQKRKRPKADFVKPTAPRHRAPKPSGPPLWNKSDKRVRLAWLERIALADVMGMQAREFCAALRAGHHNQPDKRLKPGEAAEVDRIFADAWLKDLRPIADIVEGDRRAPLAWTGANREQVRHVLRQAIPYLPFKNGQFARGILTRLDTATSALSTPSLEELERIDRVLVQAYDLGARA